MSDYRIVKCFGIKRRPRKQDEVCRNRYVWSAGGATSGNFGRKGTQACPNCGNPPDFQHPLNMYYGGDISREEAEQRMPAYIESKKNPAT
jgi:hypothetical protein